MRITYLVPVAQHHGVFASVRLDPHGKLSHDVLDILDTDFDAADTGEVALDAPVPEVVDPVASASISTADPELKSEPIGRFRPVTDLDRL